MQFFTGLGIAIRRGGADLAGEQGNALGQPEMLLRGGGNGGRGLAEHDGIHVAQSGDGFAQAAVGQQVQIVAGGIGGGEHANFQIAFERVVLQTVVGDDELQVGMGGEQGAGGFYATAGDGGGRVGAAMQ